MKVRVRPVTPPGRYHPTRRTVAIPISAKALHVPRRLRDEAEAIIPKARAVLRGDGFGIPALEAAFLDAAAHDKFAEWLRSKGAIVRTPRQYHAAVAAAELVGTPRQVYFAFDIRERHPDLAAQHPDQRSARWWIDQLGTTDEKVAAHGP